MDLLQFFFVELFLIVQKGFIGNQFFVFFIWPDQMAVFYVFLGGLEDIQINILYSVERELLIGLLAVIGFDVENHLNDFLTIFGTG